MPEKNKQHYLTCNILWLCRLWPRYSSHWCWQGLLYVLCTPGHSSDTGHVPEPGREDQYFGPLPPAKSQAGSGLSEDRGLHGEHGPGGAAVLHEHSVYRCCSFLSFRRLDLFQRVLLLLRHAHHHWLWGFCSSAEERRSPEATPLCGLHFYVHFGWVDSSWSFS